MPRGIIICDITATYLSAYGHLHNISVEPHLQLLIVEHLQLAMAITEDSTQLNIAVDGFLKVSIEGIFRC